MQLIFERGDRDAPVGHALIYFQGDDGSILATYVSVPPFTVDFSKYVPPFLQQAFQGIDLSGGAMMTPPIPPIPEEVAGLDFLRTLAERRQDDLVFAGGAFRGDQMRLAQEAQEAAGEYAEMYQSNSPAAPSAPVEPLHTAQRRYADLDEREKLNELTRLTGRLRDSIRGGSPDRSVEEQMETLAATLPAKYRANRLVEAARSPGERGERMAQLYLERSYKLFNEDYLDLERIDREIEALSE
jgi:hypothetical protein